MAKCIKVLNEELHNIFENNSDVYLLGEDIIDPYGGAFKISKGLSTKYPKRIITTPISEPSVIGMANGMALRGLIPIVEIMFGDFLTLGFDQILNHLTKYQGMYNGKVNPHVIVRTPMGGFRGYGPTHSQSLEKLFIGIPNLKVFALSHIGPIHTLLNNIILNELGPVIFIENKTLYGLENKIVKNNKIENFHSEIIWDNNNNHYTVKMNLNPMGPSDYTIVTYGGLTPIVMDVVHSLFIEQELNGEILNLTSLNPIAYSIIAESLENSGFLVTVEEGTKICNIGSQIISYMSCDYFNLLKKAPLLISALPCVIPSSKILEEKMLPSKESIMKNILKQF